MTSLRLDKLFHVLVVLGGGSGVAACEDDGVSSRNRTPDAAPGTDGGMPCFCGVQACCDRSVEPPAVEDGFSCCWSTTCE